MTGVQTCALPIFEQSSGRARESSIARNRVSRSGLQPPPAEKDRSAYDEQDELAPDVAAEHAIEKRGPGDEQSQELERARQPVHRLRRFGHSHPREPVPLLDPLDDILSGGHLTEDRVDAV